MYSNETNHLATIEEVKVVLGEESKVDADMEMLQMGVVRGYELDTFVWFRDHFDLVRERQPNTPGRVHIDFIERQEMYSFRQ